MTVAKVRTMGRRNRERIERIKAGLEKPRRWAIAVVARKGVIEELTEGTTSDQIGRLNELAGTGYLPPSKLKAAIMKKAPGEMDKAIKKFKKEGKEITVDSLLAEVRSERGFLAMCNRVGLNYEWFVELVESKIGRSNVEV